MDARVVQEYMYACISHRGAPVATAYDTGARWGLNQNRPKRHILAVKSGHCKEIFTIEIVAINISKGANV